MKYYFLGNYTISKNHNDKKLLAYLIASFQSGVSADGFGAYLYDKTANSVLNHLAHVVYESVDCSEDYDFLLGSLTYASAEFIVEYPGKLKEQFSTFRKFLEMEFGIKFDQIRGPLEIDGKIRTLNFKRTVWNNGIDSSRTAFHTFKFVGDIRYSSDKEKIAWIKDMFVFDPSCGDSYGGYFQSGYSIKKLKKNEWLFVETFSRDV